MVTLHTWTQRENWDGGERVERLTAAGVRNAKPKANGKAKIYWDGARLCLRADRCKLSVAVSKTWMLHDRTLVVAMQQMADWLQTLGMSESAQRSARERH